MYRIAVDTGGTFTDVVVSNPQGKLTIGKALTTPARSFDGLSAAIADAAGQIGVSFSELVGQTSVLIYGTTRATNAIVERKTARTALLTTEGFGDVLIYRLGGKLNPLQVTLQFPKPYIPKYLTFEVRERINAEGGVEAPIDIRQVNQIIHRLKSMEVEAVAVCFLWSIENPAHELAVGRMLAEQMPNIPCTLSHELNPVIREYPRASSAAIDASLKPLMQEHLNRLKRDLVQSGFGGELLVSASSGGVMHIDEMVKRPIYMTKSGPSMAPLAGIAYARAEESDDDIIIVDTGGTTFDVSLIRNGAIKYTRETWLGPKFISTLLGMATVDVRSVGAGGGSIAWVDAGGLLRVGPQSAGSSPGPACYGQGGKDPTVTDAAVTLGYIAPDRFLGGRMKLDRKAAESAVASLASVLRKSVQETAAAILRLSSETMIKAIEDITVHDGVNPAESVLVAGGGAAGLNIVSIGKSLGCKKVIVPKAAGAISASGAQYSDVAIDFSGACYAMTSNFDVEKVRSSLRAIRRRAEVFERDLRSRGISQFRYDLFVEARYIGQQWEMEISVPAGWDDAADDTAALRRAFDETHHRLYAVSQPEAHIEANNWRLRLTAMLPRPSTTWIGRSGSHATADHYTEAYFEECGIVKTVVHDGPSLSAGVPIRGPAIVEEPTTTIVVAPGTTGYLSVSGSYVFVRGAGG